MRTFSSWEPGFSVVGTPPFRPSTDNSLVSWTFTEYNRARYVGFMKFSHDWMSDTHPDALRVYLEINHRLPAQRKFDTVVGMCEGMALTYAAQERKLHPAESERAIFLRVAARRLGKALVKRVYGDFPDE